MLVRKRDAESAKNAVDESKGPMLQQRVTQGVGQALAVIRNREDFAELSLSGSEVHELS